MLFYFTRQIAIKTQADSAAGPFLPAFANRKQRTGIDSTSGYNSRTWLSANTHYSARLHYA
jgi:hypothetical protein